jgi:hypothetical protein
MPNEYKGGQGATPQTCYGAPIPPNLGGDPLTGPFLPMASVSNPFQPCGPSVCPAPSCCGGGSAPGGGPTADPESGARRTARTAII